jgi:hypothetical protein
MYAKLLRLKLISASCETKKTKSITMMEAY